MHTAVDKIFPSGTRSTSWRQTSWAGSRERSRPPKRKVPPRAGRSPATALMNVVFPAPLGPTIATSSPSPPGRETSQRAGASPYPTWSRSTPSIRPPEVRLDHLRVTHDVARGALLDDPAVVQDHHAVREVHDGPHDVLHEDDRGPAGSDLPDELERARHLRPRDPRQDVVHAEHPP